MRSRASPGMIGDMPQRLHLELDLERAEPITGRLSGVDGDERSFTGWLDLLAALEAALADVRAGEIAGKDGESAER